MRATQELCYVAAWIEPAPPLAKDHAGTMIADAVYPSNRGVHEPDGGLQRI